MVRPALGGVLGLFILAFGAIASVAAVQHSLHHDASSHSASCAICSLAKGQVDAGDGAFIIPQPATIVDFVPLKVVHSLPQNPTFLLPQERAPPVSAVVS